MSVASLLSSSNSSDPLPPAADLVNLKKGYKLKRVYSYNVHPLSIKSKPIKMNKSGLLVYTSLPISYENSFT